MVTKIDSVKNLANETIARYTLSDEQNRQTAVYERYGSFTGWMRSNHDGITGGGVDYLRCVYGSASEPVFRLPLPWSDIEIADDECSVWSSVPTSVDNLTHTAGCLFYNAATQTIQTQSAEAATVKVYGIDGQAIMQTQTLTYTIPFAAPAGIYIVVVQTPDNSYTEKIVIR